MDNAQKAIMIGVGLFITIIIIAAVMLITGMGQDLMNQGTQQLSQMSSQLQQQLTQEYDGTEMTGAQVLAAVKKYYGDATMAISLVHGSTTYHLGGLQYASEKEPPIKNTLAVKTGELSNKLYAGKQYISPTARYDANLLKVGEAVVGLEFKLK